MSEKPTPGATSSIEDQIRLREEKARDLRERGQHPYGNEVQVGATAKHVRQTVASTRRVIVACSFVFLSDLSGSKVETYAAVRLCIDSWRWADVPFLIRTGKRLAVTANEVIVRLKKPPLSESRDNGRPSSATESSPSTLLSFTGSCSRSPT